MRLPLTPMLVVADNAVDGSLIVTSVVICTREVFPAEKNRDFSRACCNCCEVESCLLPFHLGVLIASTREVES